MGGFSNFTGTLSGVLNRDKIKGLLNTNSHKKSGSSFNLKNNPTVTKFSSIQFSIKIVKAFHFWHHKRIFSLLQGVHKVNDQIYVAVGYALGNSIMLIGDEGVVIIDTTESVTKGKVIAEAFRNITDKPVKGIIL